MLADVSDAEIATCISVLKRLDATSVEAHPELHKVGKSLWRRSILKERFGEQDVVTAVQEMSRHKETLKRLERLQVEIFKRHEARLKEANAAGINGQRSEEMRQIVKEMEQMQSEMSSQQRHQLSTQRLLAESKSTQRLQLEEQRRQRGQGSQHSALLDPAAGPDVAPLDWVSTREWKRAQMLEGINSDRDGGGSCSGGGSVVGASQADLAERAAAAAAAIPVGSFRRYCACCKVPYELMHSFYHQLCTPCAEVNLSKRKQTARMGGMVCIVTGGRVRIGFQIALKLLRAGATVLATSRYPCDTSTRYAAEHDFGEWRERLHVFGPMELADVRAVEAFAAAVARRFGRVHALINNAAQTLTRPQGWQLRMAQMEAAAQRALPDAARETLLELPEVHAAAVIPTLTLPPTAGAQAAGPEAHAAVAELSAPPSAPPSAQPLEPSSAATGETAAASAPSPLVLLSTSVPGASTLTPPPGSGVVAGRAMQLTPHEEAAFPLGALDESRQPLDLSGQNTWSTRLGNVNTPELLHTLSANAVAPFILMQALLPLLRPEEGAPDGSPQAAFGHIVNVSALEGKFAVGKKSTRHPHTNMSKAALNMLTFTCARDYYAQGVLVNAVDTGWVTDNAPGGLGAKAVAHETHVAPPLDEDDGASRVLDPIFRHLNSQGAWRQHGFFWKDYEISSW
jgi:NAD(P)-dependent dehydrogenase (short-subunit alcohol dehydrogenase family)